MDNESTALIFGTSLAGYRAAYALCKKGHRVVLLNRGRFVDDIRYQALVQLPLDFCWICGHMPQRLFKALGSLQDNYSAKLLSVEGEAGHFHVKFSKRDQAVNNFACIECDRCVDVCPVEVNGRRAIWVKPEAGWENIYVIDEERCTECGECEAVCPTGCIGVNRPEETVEVDVGAIILATEFDDPTDEDLAPFAVGSSPAVIRNTEVARRSLLTNFVRDSLRLPSGEMPSRIGIVVTPHFNTPGVEHENSNLCVSAAYRAVKIREILPDADVTIFLRDYREFGKKHHRWCLKALDAGADVVRADALRIETGGDNRAVIHFDRGGESESREVDLAILVTGQRPPRLMDELTRICGVKPDANGFCNIRPFSSTETDVDGIHAVGELTGPKGNPETVWEGCAAITEMIGHLGKPNFTPAPPPELRSVKGEAPRVGVFICSCHGTFSDRMDLEALRGQALAIPHVEHAEIIEGCCTPPTIKSTAEAIRASGVNRVVLAVCTPLQKLLKYRKTVMMAGLNPLLSQYVRLREDVIRVHTDRDRMLTKAVALVRSAVEVVRRTSAAPAPKDSFTPRALVIGGGAAGLAAAQGIARSGFEVTLVERQSALGGQARSLREEGRRFVSDLASRVESDPNITIHRQATVTSVEGYAGNFHAVITTQDGEVVTDAGIIVVATGAGECKPRGFLCGEDERVVTQRELRSRLEGGDRPGRVVMIQCVGSRDDEHPWCSRVCCNQALENALDLREMGCEVTILYRDITSHGKRDLRAEAIEVGVRFERFDAGAYPRVSRSGDGLRVSLAEGPEIAADLVVLSTGIVPDVEANRDLSATLGLPLDEDGFFDSDANAYPFEEAIKRLTKPFELATNGIFAAGLAHSPRSLEAALLTARDAAGRAVVMLGKRAMPPPNAMYLAGVREELCMGCGLCVAACPYEARLLDPRRKVVTVRPFLCDSCGACVAACPNDASYLRDFTGKQSIAALDAVLT
ncbi:CoB--CoM heterodisulfide reductase iron-sulfur subunit A family protein [Candidatus Sumerlaeota bacterium]|nr:CoB--CoM heterodisulfide reductase iron-sulfur subunit A family protein [Candidatus Sumerlaeota bacterium]